MSVRKKISEHRSTIIFATLVGVSILSLASGTEAGVLERGMRDAVGVGTYPFLVALNSVRAGVESATGLIIDYRTIRRENRTLRREMAALQQQRLALEEAQTQNERLREMLDFERRQSRLTLMPAAVLQHSQGVVTIDRGIIHGVKPSMSVVVPDGIVGMVTDAGPFTAHVITLQNADCKVDAMIAHSRVRGRVHGSGNDLSVACTMHYIDLKDTVREDDLVVASPDSVFPSGFPVGRVTGLPRRGQLSQSATVLPAVDPFTLDEVFVVLNAVPAAQELAGVAETTELLDDVEELHDSQSIQERFAP